MSLNQDPGGSRNMQLEQLLVPFLQNPTSRQITTLSSSRAEVFTYRHVVLTTGGVKY